MAKRQQQEERSLNQSANVQSEISETIVDDESDTESGTESDTESGRGFLSADQINAGGREKSKHHSTLALRKDLILKSSPQSLGLKTYQDRKSQIKEDRSSTRKPSTVHHAIDIDAEDHEKDKYMDLMKWYRAAKRNCFINLLEQASTKEEQSRFLDSVSPLGNSVLHVAASYGNEKTVTHIASKFPFLLTKQNSKGDTALHIAAKAGHELVVKTLVHLRREYSLLRIKNDELNTALHEALINCHVRVAIDLIQADSEVIYYQNKEEKSPLYLAVEAEYVGFLSYYMPENSTGNGNMHERLGGKSPVHAAVRTRNIDVLKIILEKEPRCIHLRDEEGRTPLHCAASIGYIDGVCYLLKKYIHGAVARDKKGFFPIHWASIEGHADVIEELLRHCPDPWELLNNSFQNILHVAAESGKHDVVSYILNTYGFEKLINEKDEDGNTPLHLATINWHPKIVSILTWDKRVNLNLANNKCMTALDAALDNMEQTPSFRQQLTWAALKAAGVRRVSSGKLLKKKKKRKKKNPPPNMDNYVNTLLLVATLVATVTFAAGFTLPGGNNDSDPEQGMPTMLKHVFFQIFVLCNTIAMYSSIAVAVSLLWALLGDLNLLHTALRMASPFLGIALATMSLAFMAGVCLVVSKLSWLFITILIVSLVFLVGFLALLFILWSPVESHYCILRYVSYYPFRLLMWASGSNN